MDSNFKKKSMGRHRGILSTLRRRPHANHVLLKVEGVYDYHGVGGVGGGGNPPAPTPTKIFLKSLSGRVSIIFNSSQS